MVLFSLPVPKRWIVQCRVTRDAVGNATAGAAEGGSLGVDANGGAAASGSRHDAGLGGGLWGEGSAGNGGASASGGISGGGAVTRKPEAGAQP